MTTMMRAGLAGLVAASLLATAVAAEDAKAPAAPARPVAGAPVAATAASPAATPQAPNPGHPAAAATPPGTVGAVWPQANVSSEGGLALEGTQTDMVKTVNGYFNGIKSLKGVFVQTGADRKRMKGKFAMKRPGRFRFDYSLPSKQVIVSDGEYLAIQDLDLNNEDRVALDQTPFRLLLRKDVDLLRDAKILDVQQADDLIVLTMQDKSPDVPGRIKLFLAIKPAVELKEWVTTDAQGGDTHVEVSDLVHSDSLEASMFKIEPVGLNRTGRP